MAALKLAENKSEHMDASHGNREPIQFRTRMSEGLKPEIIHASWQIALVVPQLGAQFRRKFVQPTNNQ